MVYLMSELLTLKLISYTGFLIPLKPLHLLTSLPMIYVGIRGRSSKLLVVALLISVLPYITSWGALALTLIYIIIHIVKARDLRPLLLGLITLQLISAANLVYGVTDLWVFINHIRMWAQQSLETPSVIYLVTAVTVAVLEYSSLTCKLGKTCYFTENLGAAPIIIFMTLLLGAALTLSLGNEKTANKLAELAYYNLVIGVALQLYVAVRGE